MRFSFIHYTGVDYNTDTMLRNTVSVSFTTATVFSTWLGFHFAFLLIFPSFFVFKGLGRGYIINVYNKLYNFEKIY